MQRFDKGIMTLLQDSRARLTKSREANRVWQAQSSSSTSKQHEVLSELENYTFLTNRGSRFSVFGSRSHDR
jgi:hypothetical protein